MKLRAKLGAAAFLGLALGAVGCGANTDPGPVINFAGSCDKAVPAGQACFDVLSDFEVNTGTTAGHAWAVAAWLPDADTSPTATMKTTAKQALLDPPRGASAHAYHITEDGSHTQWGSAWYVPLGTGTAAVDLSQYTGLSFWIRSDGPPIPIKVALADYGSYPTPGGGVPPLCDVTDTSVGGLGCYDDYSIRVYPDSVWRRYDIAFSSLTTGGWGLIHAFDPRRVYALKFAVTPKIAYSEWMDDIGFYLKK